MYQRTETWQLQIALKQLTIVDAILQIHFKQAIHCCGLHAGITSRQSADISFNSLKVISLDIQLLNKILIRRRTQTLQHCRHEFFICCDLRNFSAKHLQFFTCQKLMCVEIPKHLFIGRTTLDFPNDKFSQLIYVGAFYPSEKVSQTDIETSCSVLQKTFSKGAQSSHFDDIPSYQGIFEQNIFSQPGTVQFTWKTAFRSGSWRCVIQVNSQTSDEIVD